MKINRLNKHVKFWIYNNLRMFFKTDPFFKSFNIDILLAEVKGILREAGTKEELILALSKGKFGTNYSFVRKVESSNVYYFHHPSICFQVESLLDCWSEICGIETKLGGNHVPSRVEKNVALFFEDDDSQTLQDALSHHIYGLKPNKLSTVESNASDYDKSLYEIEVSKLSPIKNDFKYEYNQFKKEVKENINKIGEKYKSGIMLQTDIKKFYHSISPEVLANFLKKHHPNESVNLVRYLNKITESFGYHELPIGWILSPFYVYFLLEKVYQNFETDIIEEFKKSSNMTLNKLKEVKVCSYVDDFVFVFGGEVELSNIDQDKFEDVLINFCERRFWDLLSINVKFHRSKKSEKSKLFNLTPNFFAIAETAFFNLQMNGSIGDDISDLFDDVLIPADNNLIINNKVQFLKALKNIHGRLDFFANRENFSEFDNVFSKILYQLENDGIKYIKPILTLVGRYYDKIRSHNNYNTEDFLDKMSRIRDLFMGKQNITLDSIIKFILTCHKMSHFDSDDEQEWFVAMISRFHRYVSENNVFTDDDVALFRLLIEDIRGRFKSESLPLRGLSSIRTQQDQLPFYHSQGLYTSLVGLFSTNVKSKIRISKHDVYIVSFAMNASYEILEFNERIDSWLIFIEKVLDFSIKKKDVFLAIVEETSYFMFRTLSAFGYDRFSLLVSKYGSDAIVFDEVLYQLKKMDVVEDYINLSSGRRIDFFRIAFFDFCDLDLSDESISKISTFKGSLATPEHSIKTLFIYFYMATSVSLDELWRSIFFRFTKIDSSLAISWKASSIMMNPSSLELGIVLRRILSLKYSSSQVFKKRLARILKGINSINSEHPEEIFEVQLNSFIDEFNKVHLFESPRIKVTVGSLNVELGDLSSSSFDPKNGLSLKEEWRSKLDVEIMAAINHAKDENSDIIIFPELSIPRKYLNKYLKVSGEAKMIFIGGLEYNVGSRLEAKNEIVVSFPLNKYRSFTGKPYWAISQSKIFPSVDEFQALTACGFFFISGNEIAVFKTDFWKNFSVLNCVDFMSLRLKQLLQGRIQTLLVASLNYDSTTFQHLAEACVRELFVYCVVCNSQLTGSSFIYAPFRNKNERIILNYDGKKSPIYSTVYINPTDINIAQGASPTTKFGKSDSLFRFKQLPPGWKKIC